MVLDIFRYAYIALLGFGCFFFIVLGISEIYSNWWMESDEYKGILYKNELWRIAQHEEEVAAYSGVLESCENDEERDYVLAHMQSHQKPVDELKAKHAAEAEARDYEAKAWGAI